MPKSPTASISHIIAMVVVLGGVSACATGSTAHWEKPGGNASAFQADNESCGAVASRVGSACSTSPGSCGTTAPPNRIDRPPHVDANPVWQRSYMECMAGRGWNVAQQ